MYIQTIANPDNNSDVVAVAFSLALLMCNRLQDSPSLLPAAGMKWPSPTYKNGSILVAKFAKILVLILKFLWLFLLAQFPKKKNNYNFEIYLLDLSVFSKTHRKMSTFAFAFFRTTNGRMENCVYMEMKRSDWPNFLV